MSAVQLPCSAATTHTASICLSITQPAQKTMSYHCIPECTNDKIEISASLFQLHILSIKLIGLSDRISLSSPLQPSIKSYFYVFSLMFTHKASIWVIPNHRQELRVISGTGLSCVVKINSRLLFKSISHLIMSQRLCYNARGLDKNCCQF